MVQEKKSKRLSRKLQKSYVIKTDIDELSDVLCELLKLLNIEELHIMTYKDRIDVFATKEMTPLHVELYERFFSLHPDDAEKEEFDESGIRQLIYADRVTKRKLIQTHISYITYDFELGDVTDIVYKV